MRHSIILRKRPPIDAGDDTLPFTTGCSRLPIKTARNRVDCRRARGHLPSLARMEVFHLGAAMQFGPMLAREKAADLDSDCESIGGRNDDGWGGAGKGKGKSYRCEAAKGDGQGQY